MNATIRGAAPPFESIANVMADPSPEQILSELRVDIDRIDADMHALLIERGGIIERLIAVKARQGGGSAFRPGREAEMMRRIAERHRGPLPLDTVESIWRVIISTFTFVQASYAVHADIAAGDASMRDTARFHFGFTVPLHACRSSADVVAAVMAAEGDLGIVPVDPDPASAPPWPHLVGPRAPKVIARLPFVERRDHPAGLPVFVIARPGAAAVTRDVVLLLLTADQGGDMPPTVDASARMVAAAGPMRLVAVAGSESDAFQARLRATAPHVTVAEVGGHAARFSTDADPHAA